MARPSRRDARKGALRTQRVVGQPFSNTGGRLSDGEGVPGALGVTVHTLEPPLVTHLDLQDVQLTAGHSGCDELVAATLVTVGCAGKDLVLVVRLALLVGGLLHVQQRSARHLAALEAALRLGLTSEGLLAQKEGVVLQELLGGAVATDAALVSLVHGHHQVGHCITVVLVPELGAREVPLLGGVPLGGDQQSVALAGVRHKARHVGGLAEHIGGLAVGSLRRLRLRHQRGSTSQQTEGCTAGGLLVLLLGLGAHGHRSACCGHGGGASPDLRGLPKLDSAQAVGVQRHRHLDW
mmetsp:Transcript_8842/g.26486  ORF Transcript_8842/g.26486 Transcript_8842/m.26486 type:complete len:294 (-) Transcript_8842:77-958(-)